MTAFSTFRITTALGVGLLTQACTESTSSDEFFVFGNAPEGTGGTLSLHLRDVMIDVSVWGDGGNYAPETPVLYVNGLPHGSQDEGLKPMPSTIDGIPAGSYALMLKSMDGATTYAETIVEIGERAVTDVIFTGLMGSEQLAAFAVVSEFREHLDNRMLARVINTVVDWEQDVLLCPDFFAPRSECQVQVRGLGYGDVWEREYDNDAGVLVLSQPPLPGERPGTRGDNWIDLSLPCNAQTRMVVRNFGEPGGSWISDFRIPSGSAYQAADLSGCDGAGGEPWGPLP